MNYSPDICAKAQRIIDERHSKAVFQQNNRINEINSTAPEIAEIQRQAASAVTQLSKLIVSGRGNFDDNFNRIKRNNLEAQEYIKNILKSKGYPEDYLEIKYTCSNCRDTGFGEDGRRCECFREIASKLSAEELNRCANMPDCDFEHFSTEYYPRTMDSNGVIPYEKMTEVLRFCRIYANGFNENSQSLLMLGKTGIGKTHLSLSIAKEIIGKGYTCIYGSVMNFLSQLEKEHFGRAEQGKDTMAALLETDLLVLDDLGSENYTGFYESMLYNIINSRINLNKPTIISTNLSIEELSGKYNERILSRIFGVYVLLRFYGRDIRQEKRLMGR